VPALRHLARTTTGGPAITVTVAPDAEAGLHGISSDVAVALYRVAREAVANAIRHSGAAHIRIDVGLDHGCAVMQVQDDGKGFDPAAAEREGRAMGLFTLRERVALLNGQAEIASRPDRGTTVQVRIPIDSGRAPATDGRPNLLENHHAG
jgi:signal transduction histidine kinase